MFDRLFKHGPRIGAEATVLVGPYAGFTGRIAEVDHKGRVRVVIDDCCQPVLEPFELVVGVPRNFADKAAAARRQIERSPDVEYTRAMAEARIAPTDKVT
jgi:hypothetical protein